MKIDVPYGKDGSMSATISDDIKVDFLEANDVTIGDEDKNIKDSINNPINSKSFKDFLSNAKKVLVIVNDATRPTPTTKILEFIFDDLKRIDYNFIIATGAHRGPSREEYLQIFGSFYEEIKDRIIVHDARVEEDMVFLGKSTNGTSMYVNKAGVEADKIVIISSVEPHYFAGYTGGRKSFLPGIAGYKTIEQNHKLALAPEAKALALEGNPVHEDMIDAIKTVKQEIFSIMTVLDKNHKVYATCCGHINDSFHAAIEIANEVFAAPLEEKADIVVSIVKFPQDIDLYQAQKGIDNAKLALKKDGIMILVAKCRCGIGGKAFADLLGSSDTPRAALETIEKGYVLGYHKAAKMAEIGLWAQMWGVTDVEPQIISKLFIKPFDDLQTAIDMALEEKGKDSSVLFLMDGGLIVPLVK
ncbi:MAG: nickel-dependent lactate racemase [Desulfobacula sp.]|jgi:lactate racemase|uniref:nickel-dependent lactate racemase n=1 Tax=Desulfobacula sp. TaxID=2593537 RepID=UPI001DFB04D3|nr:nickel-dependent lactate racemase [Desulfobacula sp.]MBT3485571.1 nickel-dependent lactate racemase [Desulfobacula sp.]MBT3805398.1 nickel-dependent lactate racemase [Desulfobacula sp.]MBT4025944.1 nickel-dependent lactate racemase [Desulfobacula sp.]MBT4197849.1 nickel-dependent lactate racemase [Desulfobacula sp.]